MCLLVQHSIHGAPFPACKAMLFYLERCMVMDMRGKGANGPLPLQVCLSAPLITLLQLFH